MMDFGAPPLWKMTVNIMAKKQSPDIIIEYEYEPSKDAQERLDEAWDIIVDLIIKDFEDEQSAQEAQG